MGQLEVGLLWTTGSGSIVVTESFETACMHERTSCQTVCWLHGDLQEFMVTIIEPYLYLFLLSVLSVHLQIK